MQLFDVQRHVGAGLSQSGADAAGQSGEQPPARQGARPGLVVIGARKLGIPRWSFAALGAAVAIVCAIGGAYFLALLASPNIGSRAWIWRQYDHIVRGGTVVRPGSDAGVVRVPCERDGKTVMKHLAFAVDCNGRFVELAPEEGAKMAIAEVCRNLVCAGAEPIG